MTHLNSVPLAYFITFTCYGTWLHGGKVTSVDRYHNIFGTPFLCATPLRKNHEKTSLKETPYLLDATSRNIVLAAIQEECSHHSWNLLAAHVRTNHVHIVVTANESPEVLLRAIKTASSHHLNNAKADEGRSKRWTRHGSTRYLWRSEEVAAAVRYVVNEQGSPMAVYNSKKYDSQP